MWQLNFALTTFFNSLALVFTAVAINFIKDAQDVFHDEKDISKKLTFEYNLLITNLFFYSFSWLLIVPTNFAPHDRKSGIAYFIAYLIYIITCTIGTILCFDFIDARDIYKPVQMNEQHLQAVIWFSIAFIFNFFKVITGIFSLLKSLVYSKNIDII